MTASTLAYAAPGRSPNQVATVDVATANPACVVAKVPPNETLQQIALTHRWAVYADRNSTLFRRDLRTGRRQWMRRDLGNVGNGESVFALSPNGRQIAFTADCKCSVELGTRVGVIPVAGGPARWLSDPWPGEAEDPTFSRLGREVAFATPSGIAVVPTRGGASKFFPLTALCRNTAWSPNGRWIACLSLGGGACSKTACSKLVLIDTVTGKTRTSAYSLNSIAWAPDSRKLAVEGPHILIGTVRVGGRLHVLATSPLRPSTDPPAWSPDGRLIAFSARKKGSVAASRIYVIRPDGKGPRRIA